MGWTRFWRRERIHRDRLEEMEEYLAIETEDNVARGMEPDAARAAAGRKLGNGAIAREEIYEMNTITFLDSFAKDLRHALRGLRRSPAFTWAAVITLAVGIGANTAVFSVVNGVLLQPLHYPKADEIVALHQLAPGAAGLANVSDGLRLSISMYLTYSDHNRSFQSVGAWRTDIANVTGLAEPEQVRTVNLTDGVLQTFAVAPVAGRWLSSDDAIPGGPLRVMLSYGYWQRRFGGEPSAVGKSIWVDSKPRQIVGVMPRGFRFADTDFDVILPLQIDRAKLILAGFGYQGVARLKPGVTLAQANSDVARMLPIWMDSWTNGPGTNPHIYETWRITPAIRPLKDEVIGSVRNILWAVMATIGLVMLIACANLTNLLLVRAEARQQELALRAALGAGRGRIVRGLLAESLVLGLIGGAFGVAVAYAGVRVLLALGPRNLPRLSEVTIDGRTLAFAAILSVLSGLAFGLIPALKYAGGRIAVAVRSAGRGLSAGRERQRARQALAVAQVAMAMVLLVSAGLMIRTVAALDSVDPGFHTPEQIQLVRTSIPDQLIADPQRVFQMEKNVRDRLAAIPGVTSVAFASEMPMEAMPADWNNIYAQDKPYSLDTIPPMRFFKTVSPGMLQVLGTPLVAGRDFTWTDLNDKRPVSMVSEDLAKEIWGSARAAVGKQIAVIPGEGWHEVVGVVANVRDNGLQETPPPTVYWPVFGIDLYDAKRTVAERSVTYAMRTARAGSDSLRAELGRAIWSVNASLPLAGVRTMSDVEAASMARMSFTLTMLEIAGAMALFLGIVGIYGVISYTASQRTREMGIRIALGAEPSTLRAMLLRSGLVLAAGGIAIGLPAAALAMQAMKSLLFGVSAMDPVSYLAAPVVLVLAAMAASWGPARRAARVDPVVALRGE